MPFGLVNSGATLVKGIRIFLRGVNNVGTYIDDIIVYTESWQEHVQTLDQILQLLEEANLTLKPSKCSFGQEQKEFIGHIISNGELKPNQENINKVKNAEPPRTKKEIQSFLGLTRYYRNFIPNYSAIAAPLTDLTKRGLPNIVEWKGPKDKAYHTMKNIITRFLASTRLQKRFLLAN